MESRVEDLFSDAVERQVAERRAMGRALEELSSLVGGLDQRLVRIEQRLEVQADSASGGVAQIEVLTEQVIGPITRLAQALDERMTVLEAAGSASDREVRDQVATLGEQLEAMMARFRDVVAEAVDGLSQRQAQSQDELQRAVLSVAQATSTLDSDALAQAVGAQLAAARPGGEQELLAVLEHVRAEVAEGLSGIQPLSARITSELADLVTTLAGVRLDVARSEADRDLLREQITTVIASLSDDLRAAAEDRDRQADVISQRAAVTFDQRGVKMVDEMQHLVGEFATELGAAMAAIAERAETSQDANADNIDLMGTMIAGFDKHLRGIRENLKKSAAELAAQSAAMDAMTGDVTNMGATLGRVVGEMQAQLAADQELAILEVRDVLAEGERRLELAGDGLIAQTDHAVEQLAGAVEVVQASADGLREELELALDEIASTARLDAAEARDEVVAAGARLDLLFDRLAGFERAVLDHLSARDAMFSRERALIVEDLVDQLAGGLGKRERKRLSSRLELPDAATVQRPAAAVVPGPRTPAPGDRDLDVGGDEVDMVRARSRVPTGRGSARPAAAARLTREDLLAIDGLGPAKVDALLDAFGTPASIAKAPVEQLAAVPGISARLAATIRRNLS